jgi:transposase
MQDREMYQHLLGLAAPWTVSEVKLDMQSQEIHVSVEYPRGTKFSCPDCQKQLSCYDHGEDRQWRHLDSSQFKTILVKARNHNIATCCSRGIPNCVAEGINSIACPSSDELAAIAISRTSKKPFLSTAVD